MSSITKQPIAKPTASKKSTKSSHTELETINKLNDMSIKKPFVSVSISDELYYEAKEFVYEARDITHAEIYKVGLATLMSERKYAFKTNVDKT